MNFVKVSIMMFVFCVSCVDDAQKCEEYPCGPYEFKQDSVVPRMTWPFAIPLNLDPEEIPLDLLKVYQDKSINSVFILVVSPYCFSCPRVLQNIQASSEVWEQYGVLWIFIVQNTENSFQAFQYVSMYIDDFGWATSDADNTYQSNFIADMPIFNSIPWLGVIRTSDMVLLYDEEDQTSLDRESIAREIAGE